MNDLLDRAVAAHGGLDRWNQIIIATTRRGYAWQGDYQRVPEPLLAAIDMGEITIG